MYELNKFQAEVLDRMANDEGGHVLTTVEPEESDSEEIKKSLTKQIQWTHDLVGLGFVDDQEESLLQIAQAASLRTNRTLHVYSLTKVGRILFTGPRKYVN